MPYVGDAEVQSRRVALDETPELLGTWFVMIELYYSSCVKEEIHLHAALR